LDSTIAITDANIFIDLIESDVIAYLFQIDYEIHTTLEVYNQLNTGQLLILEKHKQSLKIIQFTSDDLEAINQLQFPAGLEFADRSVFYYAMQLDGFVLSGDGKLRNHCKKHCLVVKGTIWVFDQIFIKNLMLPSDLAKKLEKLLEINSRLPIKECRDRINEWKNIKY
jgi:hypothetical protein